MPDTTPDTELRAAAERLRADAHRAMTQPHIALMRPELGLSLADWLTAEAATWAGDEVHGSCSPTTCTLDAARAVARQVCGTTDQQPETAPACPQCGNAGACNGGPCPLTQTAPADLRDRVAQALIDWAYRSNDRKYTALRRDETVRANAYSRADAVLAVLPAPTDRATDGDEAAILALSLAGAFCGECGFEPGDRGCADCERSWAGYVKALRAAGWGPNRMADEAQHPETEAAAPDADRIVAYRDPHNPRVLLCREHGEKWQGVYPVASEDLPDGGICTFGRLSSLTCGRDVLAP